MNKTLANPQPTGMPARLTLLRTHRLIALFSWLLILFVVNLLPKATHAADPICTEEQPESGEYVVTLCLLEPEKNKVLSGDATVTVEIEVEEIKGEDPGVQRMMFYLDDDEYLLTDYSKPYTFVLPTVSFANGVHQLSVEVLMRDKETLTGPAVKVRFENKQQGLEWPSWQVATAEPEAGEPLIVAAVGDGASGRPEMYDVVNLITSWQPDLFLYLADVYDKGTETEFYNWYHDRGRSYGRFREITNPVIGNHEYLSGNKGAAYFDYWGGVPDYYSYDSGEWHFVALNSNCSRFEDACTPDSLQFQWLEADLAANEKACTLVYFHHPRFSIGSHGHHTQVDDIWTLLAQQNVDIVLSGHEHNYQRWQPLNAQGEPDQAGITQFVVGPGGHGVRSFEDSDERVAHADDSGKEGFGALRLELYESGAQYQFINTAGEVRDEGQVRCRTAPKSALSPIPLLAYYEMSFDQTIWESMPDRSQLGRYSSDDIDVMRQQIRLAQSAGITGFIVTWHNTPELNRRLDKLIDVAEEESFSLSIRYDHDGSVDSLDQMAEELEEFATKLVDQPVFYEFERPLVIWPDLGKASTEDVARVTKPLREQLLLVSEGNLAQYESLADVVDGYALNESNTLNKELLSALGEAIHKRGGLWIAPASSGGVARVIGEAMEAEPRTAQTLREQLNLAVQSSPDAIGVISWNDFAADTHIEPSEEYGSRMLDLLKDINQINSPTIVDFDSNAPAATTSQPQQPVDTMRLAAMGVLVILSLLCLVVILWRAVGK